VVCRPDGVSDFDRLSGAAGRLGSRDAFLYAVRDNVAALKKAGRTLEETVAAKLTAAHDAKWGQFVIDQPFFTKLVYEGV
jgi:hypothetical protein